MLRRLIPGLLAATVVSACTVGPDYSRPDIATPSSYQEPVPADATSSVDLANWWRAFGDPELNSLIQTALSDSPDVKTAASRLREARAGEAIARSRLLPQVNAETGVNHIEFSKNAGLASIAKIFSNQANPGGDGSAPGSGSDDDGGSGLGSGSGAPGGVAAPGDGITTFSAGFDASWELDLFGGTRRSIEGARDRIELAQWSARDAAVSLTAEVARTYLELRTLQRREAVMEENIARQERIVQLRTERAKTGLVAQQDPIRETTSLESLRASLLPLQVEERIHMHALALLLGKPSGALIDQLSDPVAMPDTPPAIPAGLPSELLERRPDVRVAERRLAAATADVGVATANLYPKISLTGMGQLISTALSSLISTDSLQLQGAADATLPILDFGRRKGQVNQRREERQQAYIAYQKTVLGAFRDVEDALARVGGEQKRYAVLSRGVASARRSLTAEEASYTVGLVDLSAVLQARGTLIDQQQSLVRSKGQLQEALASLYKALGGGWDDATLTKVQSIQPANLDSPQTGS